MLPEVEHDLTILNGLRDQLAKTIEGLPAEALDWTPAPNTNSLAVLVTHTSGSERFLIAQTIGGVDTHRDREAEFRVSGLDAATLTGLIARARADTEAVLCRLTEAELNQDREFRGRTVTTRWCILHAIEHLAQHLGHAEMVRVLWETQNEGQKPDV